MTYCGSGSATRDYRRLRDQEGDAGEATRSKGVDGNVNWDGGASKDERGRWLRFCHDGQGGAN